MTDRRVSRIRITGLFNEINYDISLENGRDIAIITAPNGRGKTTLLNILAFVMQPTGENLNAFRSVPFGVFECVMSDGTAVTLSRLAPDKAPGRAPDSYKAAFTANYGDFRYSITAPGRPDEGLVFSDVIGGFIPSEQEPCFAPESDDPLVLLRGQSSISTQMLRFLESRIRDYQREKGCLKSVNYIRANRIQPVAPPSRRPMDYDEGRNESPLKIARRKISACIREATERYNQEVSLAKDRLPRMFLEEEGGSLDCEQFMTEWYDYSMELKRFQEIGLIAPAEDFTKGRDIAAVYPTKGPFLSTYLEAFKGTTAPLRDIYERLKLFKTILDSRNVITGKKVFFGKDGVSVLMGDREIPLDALSSGEKHDFMMFYHLIFGTERGSLVLIDEPEISLHIQWQESYLDHLTGICEMNGLQAIVATHSPNIIGSHIDCLVEKGETHG